MRLLTLSIMALTLGCQEKDDSETTEEATDSDTDEIIDDIPEPDDEEVDCSERSYTVPSTRGEMEGIWDATRQRMVFFGGDAGIPENCIPQPEAVSETWAFYTDCENFELLEVADDEPHERSRHAVAHDVDRDRMLIFGGRYRLEESGPYTLFDDLWAFDLETQSWTQLSVDAGPTPRRNATMVVAGDTLLMFGGNTSTNPTAYAPSPQLWSYDLVDGVWAGLDGASAPGGRVFHATAISDDASTMYIYGGADENAYIGPFFPDLWAYDVASGEWKELHSGGSDAPEARIWPDLLFDGANNRLLLFAGHDDARLGNTNQLWAFDLSAKTWSQLEEGDVYNAPAYGFCDFPDDFTDPDLNAPERRYGAAAVLNETDLMVFGGKTDCGQVNDLWSWSLADQSWTELSSATSGEICARTFADPAECESLCF